MGEFIPYRPLVRPKSVAELSAEAQHFKLFKPRTTKKENSRVLDLAFCPTSPHRLAIVSGTKVGLWRQSKEGEWEADCSITKFKDLTQCVSWRADGRLLLAGEASGSCAVVEAGTNKVLRRFRGHGDAVSCAAFAVADKARAATGGRDGKLRLWDVATSDLLQTIEAHKDASKVLLPGPGGPDSWITASYDGRVKLWDARAGDGAGACVLNVSHGHPVEAGARYPDGNFFVSAGGAVVRIWDLASGGKVVQELANAHAKTVMGLSLDSAARTMITASFDGLAKVYNTVNFENIMTYELPAAATCVAWRPDDGAFAVGLDDGQWQVRQPKTAKQAAAEVAPAPKQTYKERFGRLRGKDAQPAEDDHVVRSEKSRKRSDKESKTNFFLRKFEYRKVVETMVMVNTNIDDFLTIVEELLQRGALRKALHEIGEELCEAFLTKLVKCTCTLGNSSMHYNLYFEAMHSLLDGNQCLQPPSNRSLEGLIKKLELDMGAEISLQEGLMEVSGILKTVMMA